MAEVEGRVRGQRVEVATPLDVLDPGALAAADHHRQRRVVVDAVLLFEAGRIGGLLHGGAILTTDADGRVSGPVGRARRPRGQRPATRPRARGRRAAPERAAGGRRRGHAADLLAAGDAERLLPDGRRRAGLQQPSRARRPLRRLPARRPAPRAARRLRARPRLGACQPDRRAALHRRLLAGSRRCPTSRPLGPGDRRDARPARRGRRPLRGGRRLRRPLHRRARGARS